MVAINANQSTFAEAKVQQILFTKKFPFTFGFICFDLKKRILFIINPISGGKKKEQFPRLISECLHPEKFRYEVVFTEYAGHAKLLAEEAVLKRTDIVAAVGGDGTINEVASAVEGSQSALAIIPFGSGNGLARFLQISLDNRKALRSLNRLNIEAIDTGLLNGRKFFNMAGVGFDAHISAVFAALNTRGFIGYVKTTLKEIASYKSQLYLINIDGISIERRAFMLSIANSSQFGNNAHVSPKASARDGLLDVCIIKPFPLYHFPVMVYHMFSKTADKSKYVEIVRGKNIYIKREGKDAVHLDGEPEEMQSELKIEVKPLSLAVVI
mgnify:CR=1 FL=1